MAANDENAPQPTPGTSFTQRLFSEEVAVALANSGEAIRNTDWAYEFSNGRKFESSPGAAS